MGHEKDIGPRVVFCGFAARTIDCAFSGRRDAQSLAGTVATGTVQLVAIGVENAQFPVRATLELHSAIGKTVAQLNGSDHLAAAGGHAANLPQRLDFRCDTFSIGALRSTAICEAVLKDHCGHTINHLRFGDCFETGGGGDYRRDTGGKGIGGKELGGLPQDYWG